MPPENLNVEGYEDLEIRLPESCRSTTPVQLAVALSHLKVTVVTLYIVCKRCNTCAFITSHECSTQACAALALSIVHTQVLRECLAHVVHSLWSSAAWQYGSPET